MCKITCSWPQNMKLTFWPDEEICAPGLMRFFWKFLSWRWSTKHISNQSYEMKWGTFISLRQYFFLLLEKYPTAYLVLLPFSRGPRVRSCPCSKTQRPRKAYKAVILWVVWARLWLNCYQRGTQPQTQVVPLLVEGRLMIPDGKTVSYEPPWLWNPPLAIFCFLGCCK